MLIISVVYESFLKNTTQQSISPYASHFRATTLEELQQTVVLNDYQYIESDVMIADLSIQPVKTSHDTGDSQGYVIESNNHSLVYLTDTGYLNVQNHSRLMDKELYIIESNHDVNLLMEGRYPFHIKQRILGDRGHLSNEQCAYYLSKLMGIHTKQIILIHLSEDNNTEELAYETITTMLKKHAKCAQNILISKQKERTELIEL